MIYYLIGIKGSGMSALAKLLISEGHIIKGVDDNNHYFTEKGLYINFEDFYNMKLKNHYFYIIGNAFRSHKVTSYIKKMGYKYMLYPEFLNYHYKDYRWICVSGSHGKTLTTKLISSLIPSKYLIGDGSGGGDGNIFVIEACEYMENFLNYSPDILIILNIDYDHPDYYKNEIEYFNAFNKLAIKAKQVIANGDDKYARKLIGNNIIYFGTDSYNDYQFDYYNGKVIIDNYAFKFPLYGKHYAYDLVASYIAMKKIGISYVRMIDVLKKFKMPKRRFEIKKINNTIIIADYAHHPTEIKALYSTIKEKYPNLSNCIIFEPHTYTRTNAFKEEFKEALGLFDECYLLPVFTSIREGRNISLENELYSYLSYSVINSNDINSLIDKYRILLLVGAGNIYNDFLKL